MSASPADRQQAALRKKEGQLQKAYEQRRQKLYAQFVKDLERLAMEDPDKAGRFPEQIRHINVLKWHFGWQDYTTETWHRESYNWRHESPAIEGFQSPNLLLAGLEPFVIYQELEDMQDDDSEHRDWPHWATEVYRKGRNVLFKMLYPRWFWMNLLFPGRTTSRWQNMKISLAFYLLQRIDYYHR